MAETNVSAIITIFSFVVSARYMLQEVQAVVSHPIPATECANDEWTIFFVL